jgi:hypothetical protein
VYQMGRPHAKLHRARRALRPGINLLLIPKLVLSNHRLSTPSVQMSMQDSLPGQGRQGELFWGEGTTGALPRHSRLLLVLRSSRAGVIPSTPFASHG